jgi:hypothetical protein
LTRNFEADAVNSDPADFSDPRNEGYSYEWLPAVTWKVTSSTAGKRYVHDGLNTRGVLSFRRYKGTALGTENGLLPDHYLAELDVTPIQSYSYAPTGDQGTQFYYLDPTHYVELLLKPNAFEVWVCDGGEPFQNAGWSLKFVHEVANAANQTRKLGAEIDCTKHTLDAYFDGVKLTTMTLPLIKSQPHWLALRGTGNIVAHDNLRIQTLP